MKITTKQIEIIMARWNAFAIQIAASPDDKGYLASEQAFVFGAISQILNCDVSEIILTDLPPAATMCLMSARPLSSVYPANPESVRLRGGRL